MLILAGSTSERSNNQGRSEIMKLLTPSIFLSLLSSTTVAIPAIARAPILPPAGGVNLTGLTVDLEGGGCKPGEASVTIARDNSALTIIFDNFQAADGPTAGKIKTRAFCRVIIGINSPGYAFDITSADFRGYVSLDKGAEASLVTRWKWIDANGNDMKGKVSLGSFEAYITTANKVAGEPEKSRHWPFQ